jgi:hypothetical protein
MSDNVRSVSMAGCESSSEEFTYEAPTVTLIGNARDLLAGAGGTLPENPSAVGLSCSAMSKNASDGC